MRRRLKRGALGRLNRGALVGLLICVLLTVTFVIDWSRLVAPAAVPALAGAAGAAELQVRFPFSLLVGHDAQAPKRILGSVIPLWNAAIEPAGTLPGGALGAAVTSLAWLTGVNLTAPEYVLSSEIPVMAYIKPPLSVGSIPLQGPAPFTNPPQPASGPEISEPGLSQTSTGGGPGTAPLVGIYHTHARESFLPDLPEVRNKNKVEEAFTTDLKRSVVAVGDELAAKLRSQYGIAAVHSPTIHDQESSLGAYTRSEQTAKKMLADNPSIKILLDIHRDSALRKETTVKVNRVDTAKVLMVVGTDKTLPHPNWKQNYAFAVQMTAVLEGLFPGISRGIMTKTERYNQHLLPQAMLVEVGGPENSLEEVKRTADDLAAVIAAILSGKVPATAGTATAPATPTTVPAAAVLSSIAPNTAVSPASR